MFLKLMIAAFIIPLLATADADAIQAILDGLTGGDIAVAVGGLVVLIVLVVLKALKKEIPFLDPVLTVLLRVLKTWRKAPAPAPEPAPEAQKGVAGITKVEKL